MISQPFDAECRAHLAAQAAEAGEWDPAWPLARQREAWEAACRKARARRPERLMVEDMEVDGLHLRIYRPPGEDPKPGVLYAHGGGWTMGSCETHDDLCAELADQADVVVVCFDYRLAPEHPHPAQVEDALTVLDWMRSSGRAMGIDPTHIIAAGDSAGGQVAAGTALAIRRDGGRALRGMVLINPAVGGDTETGSYMAQANSPALGRDEMIECLVALLGPKGSASWSDPTGVPNSARDVGGLPPTFISVAAHDPLHDDGVIFAGKLKAAGVPVALREEAALAHSYWRSRHHSKAAMAGFKAIADAVRHLAHEGALPPS
ncbi:carboxylesterase [Aestuariivirga litoralis]|uniref:Carboxylesterase n=1 Tax=Aestuariivirga litoralis TaxID=2650924 RepID=A0A2W2BKF7_9HYPH|nr:alpha/beta hydrolase [Aestuariivirga litoralis]PZF76699.1 carboxylesterase [Aestuariivirga litoralis]